MCQKMTKKKQNFAGHVGGLRVATGVSSSHASTHGTKLTPTEDLFAVEMLKSLPGLSSAACQQPLNTGRTKGQNRH